MKFIFIPAIALLNRLGYRKKFMVIGSLALLAIVLLVTTLYQRLNQVVQASSKELSGIQAVIPLAHLVQDLQKHRGLSSALLNGGNQAIKDKRSAKEAEVIEDFKRAEPGLMPALRKVNPGKKSRMSGRAYTKRV